MAFAQTPTAVPELSAGGRGASLDLASEQTQIGLGDVAVSGFSGSVVIGDSAVPGSDASAKTLIDIQGPSLRVFDMSAIGAVPAGQVATPHAKFEISASIIGQVFGLALDQGSIDRPPNLFAGATSAFGIQIVAAQLDAAGKPIRLGTGAQDARFMDGQFGGMAASGPGTIYRIDGSSGTASVFANMDWNGIANSGPGIGALAFDPTSNSLYASDLDNGIVHRFAVDDTSQSSAASRSQFDHGAAGRPAAGRPALPDDGRRMDVASPEFRPADPATWGMTQQARRITGLAVHEGRLFYAVAEGPEIWSVSLTANGDFGADARIETAVRPEAPATVTTIMFDGQGRMIVALRGVARSGFDFNRFVDPNSGSVLRFLSASGNGTPATNHWLPGPQEYAVGAAASNRNAAGGASLNYGFGSDGVIDVSQCDATMVLTGDGLADPESTDTASHGLQLNAADLVRPANAPPTRSVFVDFDGRRGDTDARGHIGSVLAFRRCPDAAVAIVADAAAKSAGADESGGTGVQFPDVRMATESATQDGTVERTGAMTDAARESQTAAGKTAQMRTGEGDVAVAQPQECQTTTANNRACDPFDPNKKVAQPTGLIIEKKARSPTCTKNIELSQWNCDFKIVITNTGASTFQGPVELSDASNFLTRVTLGDKAGSCTNGASDHRCRIDDLALAPRQKVEFDLNTELPFTSVPISTPPGGCKLDNTVTILEPPGSGSGQRSTATTLLPIGPNAGRAVPCDPPNLRLSKTAKGCTPTGNSFECRYQLTATSIGPDPFQEGIVDIDEMLPPGAVVRSVSAGWICWGASIDPVPARRQSLARQG